MLQHRYNRLTPELIGYLYSKYSLLLKMYLFEQFGEDIANMRHRQLLELIDLKGPLKNFIEKINSGVNELPDREHFQQYAYSLMA